MTFPVYLQIGTLRMHPHWVLETLAYAAGFRVYLWLRARAGDAIADVDRWWVVAAAAMGAVVGSKILYWFEDPRLTLAHWNDLAFMMGGKTIVGALVGANPSQGISVDDWRCGLGRLLSAAGGRRHQAGGRSGEKVKQFEQKPETTPVTNETGKKRSSYRPIAITLLCAVLLGGGSCFGFLATPKTLQGTNPLINSAFAIAFIACVFVFLGALIWLIVAWLKRRLN